MRKIDKVIDRNKRKNKKERERERNRARERARARDTQINAFAVWTDRLVSVADHRKQ